MCDGADIRAPKEPGRREWSVCRALRTCATLHLDHRSHDPCSAHAFHQRNERPPRTVRALRFTDMPPRPLSRSLRFPSSNENCAHVKTEMRPLVVENRVGNSGVDREFTSFLENRGSTFLRHRFNVPHS